MGRTATRARKQPQAPLPPPEEPNRESHRDTVEAIVVALILALVVRGFEAQAFVIPTGSMAPTLMGRHKELACPQCGFTYTVNASEEVEGRPFPRRVYSGICVNCRHQATRLDEAPSFKGDRILVMMFPYDLPFLPGASEPERWDVVVFRYPEEPEVSYIKRLVGLPGEVVRIHHGDVYVKSPDRPGFRLAKKPPEHQAAMQIAVHEDARRPAALAGREEWRRWQPTSPGDWLVDDPQPGHYRSAETALNRWAELRYHHLVPDPEQWAAILDDRPLPRKPRATLITDFYSYNTNLGPNSSDLIDDPRGDQEGAWLQPHWVGDLTLGATVEPRSSSGRIRFELIRAGIAYRCEIDLATGDAELFRGSEPLGREATRLRGSGSHRVEFANVDGRLTLWIDGQPIWPLGMDYEQDDEIPVPTEADLAPAAIAVRDGSVTVKDLVLKRDIYYTQDPGRIDYLPVWEDRYPRNPVELFDFLSDSSRFYQLAKVRSRDYELQADRYLMLGDNSPRSKDSRGWGRSDLAWDPTRRPWEVPRNLLTGKAFFIYWPHGVPFGPGIRIWRDTQIPFRPYFERMKWIR